MTKFKEKMPQIEKAISSGVLDKDDVQKVMGKSAGIDHKDIKIGNIVKLVDKIAEKLNRELDIFHVARKKELTDKYKRDEVIKSVPYPDNEMSIKNIDKYQEILKLLPSQYALEDEVFDQKLLKKELLVRDYQSRRLKKQALYLLIDVSGSMSDGSDIYASGVALALVRQAIEEGSTYFLRFFDHGQHKLHKITTKEDAIKMCEILVKKPYSGGGTSIQGAIRKAIKDIKQAPEKFEKVEIMVITDGEDDVYLTKKDLKDIKIHSTVINGENGGLKAISESYVELDSSDIDS